MYNLAKVIDQVLEMISKPKKKIPDMSKYASTRVYSGKKILTGKQADFARQRAIDARNLSLVHNAEHKKT